MDNQPTDGDGIEILEEIRRLIVLGAEEHGVIMAEHSQELFDHIEWTLASVSQAMSDGEPNNEP